MTLRKAIQFINRRGILLVFPIQNRKEPPSLWSEFHPRSKMKWEWDDSGDSRVADLWHLREELSRSGMVVYAKWYQGRATFFSHETFTTLLTQFMSTPGFLSGLGEDARNLLNCLEETSPLSTKQLKAAASLQGKFLEPNFNTGMRQLWQRLLIVGFGEVDDGAFPSLAVGSTQNLFEGLWKDARNHSSKSSRKSAASEYPPIYDPFRLKILQKLESSAF